MKQRFEGGLAPVGRSEGHEIGRILVPIDFSEYSTRSLQYAIAFAGRFDSKLILLSVIETALPAYDFGATSPALLVWGTQIKKQTRDKLIRFAEEQVPTEINYECIAETGDPTTEILHAASVQKADLIVMATHGRSGMQHMLLGSVAEKTIGFAPCPVLVVRRVQRPFISSKADQLELNLKHIVVPTDFSNDAQRALAFAETLAKKTRARLSLLHVVPVHYAVGEYDGLDFPRLEAELMESGERHLAKLRSRIEQRDIEGSTEITRGSVRGEIMSFVDQSKCDLVVMGTRGLTGLKHLVLGSTAEYVVQHAPCAVLTVPKPSRVRLESRKRIAGKAAA
jgi:nucleotide-binding universal stress UspA family protein